MRTIEIIKKEVELQKTKINKHLKECDICNNVVDDAESEVTCLGFTYESNEADNLYAELIRSKKLFNCEIKNLVDNLDVFNMGVEFGFEDREDLNLFKETFEFIIKKIQK